MEATGNLHDKVIKIVFGVAENICDDPAAFHACNHVLDTNAETSNHGIPRLVFS